MSGQAGRRGTRGACLRGCREHSSHTAPCPPGIGELKASGPSPLGQLPLAPVFQPTPHMRLGELVSPALPRPSRRFRFLFEGPGQLDGVPERKDSEVSKLP